ncbi:autotransporter domain-containing protein [Mesorhizobium sp. 1B3]|uniref:autotransporter domain-containing protein n=1 Tax=Mesorhizobium sp. 1B3 TaxID=3243599 RepID=UPI003D951DA3
MPDLDVGNLKMSSYSVGAYWTHHWPNAAYLDTVLMYSWLDAEARSLRELEDDFDGTEFAASIEGGVPFNLKEAWQIEPQAQLIWQHQDLGCSVQEFSTISFDNIDAVTGRVGGRLVGEYLVNDVQLGPFAKANIWHVFSGTDAVNYNTVSLTQEREATSLELGVGLTADFNVSTGIYANVDYTTGPSSTDLEALEGRLGLRMTW